MLELKFKVNTEEEATKLINQHAKNYYQYNNLSSQDKKLFIEWIIYCLNNEIRYDNNFNTEIIGVGLYPKCDLSHYINDYSIYNESSEYHYQMNSGGIIVLQ